MAIVMPPDETEQKELADQSDLKVRGSRSQPVPDGGWGWAIVFGCSLMHFLLGGYSRSFGVTYVELRKQFDSSAAGTSLVGGINVGLRFFCGPLATALSGHFSERSVTFLGGLMMGVSSVASGLMPSIYLMLLPYSIGTGIGGALVYSPALVLVNKYFDKRRGLAAGIASSGSGLGVFLFPPLVELLFKFYGFFGAFLLLGGLMFNNCVSAALYRPLQSTESASSAEKLNPEAEKLNPEAEKLNPEAEKLNPEEDIPSDDGQKGSTELDNGNHDVNSNKSSSAVLVEPESFTEITEAKKEVKISWCQYLGLHNLLQGPFQCYCLALTLATLAYVSAQQLVIDFARDLHIEDNKAVFLLSVIGILDTSGRLAAGVVFDFPTIRKNRRLWYCMVLFGTGSSIIGFSFCTGYVGVVITCVIHGLFNGAVVSQRSVVMTDVVGIENLASAFGLCIACQGIGVFVGPFIAGVLKDVTGVYTLSFVFAGSSCILGAVVLFVETVHRTKVFNTNAKSSVST